MTYDYRVYCLASKRNGTLYLGVTNNLGRRVYEHRTKMRKGFTSQYDVKLLVWYEHYRDINEAITREKNLKTWRRNWKLRLIEEFNPDWRDLYEELNH
jgi:putative endonuclease